jgi:hypothetical protein
MPYPEGYEQYEQRLTTIAARWGADMELEACVEWLDQKVLLQHQSDVIPELRAARRPKPPTLKEEAIHELENAYDKGSIDHFTYHTIRRALEQLDD